MRLEEQLSRSIADQVDQVSPPRSDLESILRRGRSRRRRRHVGIAIAGAAVLLGGLAGANGLVDSDVNLFEPQPDELGPVGRLDFTEGLRAFMSPDPHGKIWLGGRSFPVGDLDFIDTDATATPLGMVFFDRSQQARLLREDGTDIALAKPPESPSKGFHPSSKADTTLPLVAWTELAKDAVNVRLYDLRATDLVDSLEVPCTNGTCSKVRVEAVDQGLVFVRTTEGTYVWDPSTQDARWTLLNGPDTRVAEARGKRILHTGPRPQPSPGSPIDGSWSFTEGPIDAQLSFDGRHLLNWSTTLQPTTTDGHPIKLDSPTGDLVWVTFDTDGSVMVAAAAASNGTTSMVYDCEIPSGSCTELGIIKTASGDPMFVGNDM